MSPDIRVILADRARAAAAATYREDLLGVRELPGGFVVFLYLATTGVPGMFSKGRTQLYIVRTIESSHEDDESGIGDDVGAGDSEEEALADAGDHYP